MRSRAAAARRDDDRECVIREFMPYIRYTARRLSWRLPPGLSEEDLVSAGVMGLLDALGKYRAGEVKLKTYAEYRIKGPCWTSSGRRTTCRGRRANASTR